MDKITTAEVLPKRDKEYIIMVEVFGKGIDMWIRSQGNNIELLQENLNRI